MDRKTGLTKVILGGAAGLAIILGGVGCVPVYRRDYNPSYGYEYQYGYSPSITYYQTPEFYRQRFHSAPRYYGPRFVPSPHRPPMPYYRPSAPIPQRPHSPRR